ncbi:MAG: helix-turn-helix domain-containing protein [Desulfobacterales bacterium]|nr:helix-turn-helix domain-containing protein [Desulfobacterales bacterium]
MKSNDRLKFIRKKLKYTQEKFAKLLNIPHYTVRDIEGGKIKISVEIADQLDERFNFNFKWILTGKGDHYKNNKKTNSLKSINPPSNIDLKDRLRLARERAGLKQDELSEKTGISLRSISDYEKSSEKIPLNKLQYIADVCKVDLGWLLGIESKSTINKPNLVEIKKDPLDKQNWEDAINRIMDVTDLSSETQLAETLEIPVEQVKKSYSRRIFPASWILKIAEIYKINPTYISKGLYPVKMTYRYDKVEGLESILNVDVLKEVIEGIDETLNENKKKISYEKKALLTVLLYEHFYSTSTKVSKKKVSQYLQLMAS